MHEVVRKDKYSKEDVKTPIEPVLTSRCVRQRSVWLGGRRGYKIRYMAGVVL